MATGDAPPFDATLEISTDEFDSLAGTCSTKHISVTPKMNWPYNPTTNISKYSFVTTDGLQFEADFCGKIQLRLLETVLLSLKGVEVIPRSTLKRPKLPFKLAFPEGVMLKTSDRIIDTFPDSPPPPPKVPSWFTSQPPPSTPPQLPDSPAHSSRRLSSSPDHQPSSPLNEQTQVKRQPSINRGALDKRSSSPIPPPRPSPGPASREHRVDAARPKKRPRESTEDASEANTQAGGGPSRAIAPNPEQGHRSETLAGNDSTIQKPKKKRQRKGKKSNMNMPARNPALDMVAGFWSNLVGLYMPLADAPKHKYSKVSIMGVVRGISLPKTTKTGDWSVSVELYDPSTTENNAFVVNLFLLESVKDCMPNVQAGDVLILLKIGIVGFNGGFRGTGYKDSFTWAGYSPTQKVHFHSANREFKDEDHCPFFTPGPDELQYAARLVEWWTAVQDLAKTKPEGMPTLLRAPKGRSLITLAEAKVDVFFNCIVEILYSVPPGDQFAEIFVTDYTVHPQFFERHPRENDKFEHVKVFGKRVLKVTLWGDTQLEHVKELDTPGYYYIDNLRVKFDSKGHLEGTLQDDRRKIDKLRKDDKLLDDLLERKAEYMKSPPSPSNGTTGSGPVKGRDFNLHTAGDLLPPPVLPPMRPREPKPQRPQESSLTRLLYYNITQTPIKKVLGHHECPEIFRIRARIAAFEPYKLENFARAHCTKCTADIPTNSAACHDCEDFDKEYVAYEYRFRIVVEEESADHSGIRASLIIDVSGKEAEMFLSGLPPDNFRDAKNARKLRERLSPVLGNLEAYQCDLATGDSLKARVHGQYFDMLVQSHHSLHKSDSALDNKRYKLWGTELLPPKSSA